MIIGFSKIDKRHKFIVSSNGNIHYVKNISPYLYNSPSIIVTRSSRPLCNVPEILLGNKPTDKGHLSKYSIKEMNNIVHKYPYLFRQVEQPNSNYLLIPTVTSMNRKYVPIGYMNKNIIVTNLCLLIPNATYYLFGIVESRLSTLWIALVSGRYGPSFRYSAKITYNNFPWPTTTDNQKQVISKTAQDILDTRLKHKGEPLADFYNPLAMPLDLQEAHCANDKAVLKAYRLKPTATKNEIIIKLLKMYAKLTRKSK